MFYFSDPNIGIAEVSIPITARSFQWPLDSSGKEWENQEEGTDGHFLSQIQWGLVTRLHW